MGNVINHKRIVIDFDVWEPFKKDSEDDLDKLVGMVRTKELLKHCGNVHLRYEESDKGDK